MKIKSWVETALCLWIGIDTGLVVLALYMQRIFEIGLGG